MTKITGVFLLVTTLPLAAQQFRDNQDREMRCEDHMHHNGQFHSCEVREQSLSPGSSLKIDASPNGGVTVKGWNRNEMLVRSKIESNAPTQQEADSLLHAVSVQANSQQIRSNGPSTHGHTGWSVSFEVFVPHQINVTAQTENGGVRATDLSGTLHLETVNGGLHLARVAGDVKGVTVNGGVQVSLMGNHWEGSGLSLQSTNGGVHMNVPEHYSARLEMSTVNGGVHADIPNANGGSARHAQLWSGTLGSGGALIRVSTVNGGVHVEHGDAGNDI